VLHENTSRRSRALLGFLLALTACSGDADRESHADASASVNADASHAGSSGASSGRHDAGTVGNDASHTGNPGSAARDASISDPGAGATDAARSPERDAGMLPSACPAADMESVPGAHDTFVANTGKEAVSSLTYTNVGATGAYAEVVTGWSEATGCMHDSDGMLCKTTYRAEKHVSGELAPFDEEMTMVFAGPMELYRIAVYRPSADGWDRVAYWDPCTTSGLAFAGNKAWYECGGFVESYVSADGSEESDTPVQFAGHLAAGTEINVMSSTPCNGSAADSDCGYSSGLALHGFKGDAAGSKIFAVTLRMPIGDKTPAYWILPSQVIRSSQYGCNCRGAGSDPTYKGGCGELDVAEILGGVTTSLEATTTLYSFQDITGGGSVAFNRPVDEAAVFLVIFDARGRQIAIRRLAPSEFAFESALSSASVERLLQDQGTVRALK
jgi:hypothetical protein